MPSSFDRKLSQNIGTAATSVGSYTVPSGTSTTIIGLSLANVTTSGVTVDVILSSNTANTHLVKDAPIPPGGSLVAVGGEQKIVLTKDDSIKVSSNTATSVDAILSVLEQS